MKRAKVTGVQHSDQRSLYPDFVTYSLFPCKSVGHPSRRLTLSRLRKSTQAQLDKVNQYADRLRKQMTDGEKAILPHLGPGWSAQHPITHLFILDFYCEEARLCLEIDGLYHDSLSKRAHDRGRDTLLLKRHKIETLRISDFEVLANPRAAAKRANLMADRMFRKREDERLDRERLKAQKLDKRKSDYAKALDIIEQLRAGRHIPDSNGRYRGEE